MEARGERMGGVQAHKRMVASLEKQIAVQEKKLEQVSVFCYLKKDYVSVCLSISKFQLFLFQVQEKHNKLQETLSEAEEQLSQVMHKIVKIYLSSVEFLQRCTSIT